jgi:hypothetical protein
MFPTLTAAIAQLRDWALKEDANRLPGGGGRAASRAALLRKCALELERCPDLNAGREVLCRHAALARDDLAPRLHLLAAVLVPPRVAANDEGCGE